ncbi:RNA polymerase principal sigma factor HrdC [Dissostichus eleginoides]|uniref:RNA polymerase principal sigma factor HrdC n=1 Tax=Dissostichus eleginoides TaxID=100907 RepID=A0AAD9B7B8_DISEL|nr:RNA polymerase principal sigma factor HrdC [Dissostichus eleginoides]
MEIGGPKPIRRMGRQESPLSRDTLIPSRDTRESVVSKISNAEVLKKSEAAEKSNSAAEEKQSSGEKAPKSAESGTLRLPGGKEERAHLEVLEENPTSPSSPSSNKPRPMSPGEKASFVTQLTTVAKTVLKGGQEGVKGKDNVMKTSEEKKGNVGKAEGASAGGRRGGQASVNMADRGNIRSSKHHS